EKASPLFTLRDAKPDGAIAVVKQEPAGASGIESVTKAGERGPVLLAVNADDKARTATFRLPASAKDVKEGHVLFENRKLTVTDGTFTDSFEPYDTHVYATVP